MTNINDYLIWRGDLPINKKFPFNEIDALILGRFSYLTFHKIKMNKKETIESISKKMRGIPNEDFLLNGDKELITNLGDSDRFKNLLVTDYVRNSSKGLEKQFSAITIHLSMSELYVSYIGTDDTINGWKEDFNMMFLENVPCQISGTEYLTKISKKYPYCKIRIGGHSKGGNIAIYSAITVTKTIQKRIIKVYNYDGPGFRKEVLDKYDYEGVINKIESYIPQDSIVGRLLYHKEKMTITHSIEKGVMQHDIYSWEVLKDDLVYSERITEDSEDIDETITTWFEETTNEQRRIVVDTVFDLLYSSEVEDFEELSQNIAKKLPTMIKTYKSVSKEDREMIGNTVSLMVKKFINIKAKREKQKLKNDVKRSIKKIKIQAKKTIRNKNAENA